MAASSVARPLRAPWFLSAEGRYGLAPDFFLPSETWQALFPHQRDGVAWLWSLQAGATTPIAALTPRWNEDDAGAAARTRTAACGLLGDDMGMGKTVQVAAFLEGMFAGGHARTALIIAPTSVQAAWQQHIERWCPSGHAVLFTGGVEDRRAALDAMDVARAGRSRPTVLIVSYGMTTHNETTFNEFPVDQLILDEAHSIKNPRARRTRAARGIAAAFRLLLTGTPLPNRMNELWALFSFASRDTLLGSRSDFARRFQGPIERGRAERSEGGDAADSTVLRVAAAAATALRSIIAPHFLRREKSAVEGLAVPATAAAAIPTRIHKLELVIWTPITTVQLELYRLFLVSTGVQEALAHGDNVLPNLMVVKKLAISPMLLSRRERTELFTQIVEDGLNTAALLNNYRVAGAGAVHHFGHQDEKEVLTLQRTTRSMVAQLRKSLYAYLGPDVTSLREYVYKASDGATLRATGEPTTGAIFAVACQGTAAAETRGCHSDMAPLAVLLAQMCVWEAWLAAKGAQRLSRTEQEEEEQQRDAAAAAGAAAGPGAGSSGGGGEAAATTRLLKDQASGGPQYASALAVGTRMPTSILRAMVMCSSKLQYVARMLRVWRLARDRVLIFASSKVLLTIVAALLRARGISYARLDGDVPIPDRQVLVDAFNRPDGPQMCLITVQVGAVGLTLTGANHVVILEPSWTPADDAQAVDRAYRTGQAHNVTTHRLITPGTIEECKYALQVYKDGVTRTIIRPTDGTTTRVGRGGDAATEVQEEVTLMTRDDARALLSLRNTQRSILSSCIPHDADLIASHRAGPLCEEHTRRMKPVFVKHVNDVAERLRGWHCGITRHDTLYAPSRQVTLRVEATQVQAALQPSKKSTTAMQSRAYVSPE